MEAGHFAAKLNVVGEVESYLQRLRELLHPQTQVPLATPGVSK